MAFHHLAGVTTPGAPDEVVDWFATFEAWITATVGWTVVAGTGTTDLYLRSQGEAGGLTMLYVHIWRDAAPNDDHVLMEVCDDAIPTHTTNEGGYVDSGGVQFAYWISADLDAIAIVWKAGAGYRAKSAGLLYPFALTVPDETYHSVATNDRLDQGSILRNHTNIWDVDGILYQSGHLSDNAIDRFDGSVTLCGRYFNRFADIAGQLKHISGWLRAPGVNPEDTLTSGLPGGTTEWIVLADSQNRDFALRTGGVLPTGRPDSGHFAHVAGVAANAAALVNALTAFLTAIGWTDQGSPGIWTNDRLYSSTGESGEEVIYIHAGCHVPGGPDWYTEAWDDAVGTHQTTNITAPMPGFPVNYWISGDLDCFIFVWQVGVTWYGFWSGLTMPFPPGLNPPYGGPALSEYSVVVSRNIMGNTYLLREHDGTWNEGCFSAYDNANAPNSSPNSFDGTTYILWPMYIVDQLAMLNYEPIGQCKYWFYIDGGGIAALDTVTVGARVYTVFWDNTAARFFAIRTV